MKAAKVTATRVLADGRRLLQVVCPICDHRHWIPDAGNGFCTRRPGEFSTAKKST